jgi:hypothetical protein
MQSKLAVARVVRTMCVWLLVGTCVVAWGRAAWADQSSTGTTESHPFYGVLRFLAPPAVHRHHDHTRAVWVARRHTHPTRRSSILARARLRRFRRFRVAGAVIVPFYPGAPYPPGFVPPYPVPPPAYAGAPGFAGYGYPPGPYGYPYASPYPYNVYYAAPGYYGAPRYYGAPWPPGY